MNLYIDPEMEVPHRDDSACSYCAKTVYSGHLQAVTLGGSTSWLCEPCHARQLEQYQEMTALDGIDIAAKEAAREVAL